MRAAVQKSHRGHRNVLGHRERDGLARLKPDFDRLARRIACRHDIDRMRHAVIQLDHELTETAVHSIAHRFDGPNVRQRTASDRLPGLRIVVRGPDRLDDHRAESAMTPRDPTQCMVVPEHRPHIGIDPESLSDEFDRHDILDGMIVLQGTKSVISFPLIDLTRPISFPPTLSAPMRISTSG